MIRILQGDCRTVMATLPEASVDSIVCDPPYELTSARPGGRSPATEGKVMKGFMGMAWDGTGVANDPATWAEALRVLKPGGHLLAFSGTRTYHRMVCAIEDAGFEIRDQIGWLYGSGFPKSLDVSKAIDKARDDRGDILRVTSFMAEAAERAGITRGDVDAAMGTSDMGGWWLSTLLHRCQCPKWDQWLQLKVLLSLGADMDAEVWRLNGRKGTPGEAWAEREFYDEPTGGLHGGTGNTVGAFGLGRQAKPGGVTDVARQWQGWGTALKPAWEPIVVARKPLIGTAAANVLAHGTGALNIDGCRVEASGRPKVTKTPGDTVNAGVGNLSESVSTSGRADGTTDLGRWPANIIHDGSDEALAAFPQARSYCADPATAKAAEGRTVSGKGDTAQAWGYAEKSHRPLYADSGSAARFFYTAKASAFDRHDGLPVPGPQFRMGSTPRDAEKVEAGKRGNHHPTVKPTDLMRYLCRLVTPPGGTVLDPFAGSGSTLKAAELEGFNAIGIELDPAYIEIARRRIASDAPLFADVST